MPKQKATAKAKGKTAPSNGGDDAAPSAAIPAATWTDTLTEAEQELEQKKRQEREKKAQAAKKKEEDDRWWREKKEAENKRAQVQEKKQEKKNNKQWVEELQRAKAEGVLEALEYDDGLWYVEIAKDTWKQVDTQYFCKYCEASLNEHTVGSHLSGERHRKALAYAGVPCSAVPAPAAPPAVGSASPATPAPGPSPSAAWSATPATVDPRWQELDPATGNIKCMPCGRVCDGNHELTETHQTRLKAWLSRLSPEYTAPPQDWLAWVECDQWGGPGERYLKCLLCNKFVQDLEGYNTVGYNGTHGNLSNQNQKDHHKKVSQIDAWRADPAYWGPIKAERERWHPRAKAQSAAPAPLSPSAAAASTRPPIPSVPDGWRATWSEKDGKYYYDNLSSGAVQWQLPAAPAPAAQSHNTFAALDEPEEC